MKRVIVVVLAMLMLGLVMPKPSEANGAWVPAAVIGGIIFGAALTQAALAAPLYAYHAPEPAYSYRPPAQVYVNPPHVHQYYYRYGYGDRESRHGYWRDRGRSLPPQSRWDRAYR